MTSTPALVDNAIEHLEGAIVAGAIGPGQRPSEQTLAVELGINRGPLREAVRTLEGRLLAERTPFSRVRVVSPTLDEFEQPLVLREALEGMASRHAAECMTLPETRRLRASLTEFSGRIEQEDLGDALMHGTQENDFHTQIVRGGPTAGSRGLSAVTHIH